MQLQKNIYTVHFFYEIKLRVIYGHKLKLFSTKCRIMYDKERLQNEKSNKNLKHESLN